MRNGSPAPTNRTWSRPEGGRVFGVEADRSQLAELGQRLRDGRLTSNVGAVRPLWTKRRRCRPRRSTRAQQDDHPSHRWPPDDRDLRRCWHRWGALRVVYDAGAPGALSYIHVAGGAGTVRVQTSALRPTAVPRWGGWGYIREINLEVCMLLALAVILLILAVVGGIAIHPLLFLIALLAVLALLASRTGRF
jgi:hypothetical protein